MSKNRLKNGLWKQEEKDREIEAEGGEVGKESSASEVREELNKRGKKGRDLRLTSSQPVTLQYVGSLSTL